MTVAPLALTLAVTTPAGAQDLQQKLAAAKQNAAQNQQALRSYGWIEKVSQAGPGVLVLKFSGYVMPGDALSLTFDSAVKSLRQLDVSTYLETPESPVTLGVAMQSLPDGTRRITNSSYQKLAP